MGEGGLVGIAIACSSGVGDGVTELFEASFRRVLDHVMDFFYFQPMRQVPFQQRRDEEDHFPEESPDQASTRLRHDVIFLGKGIHERTNVLPGNLGVLEHGDISLKWDLR